MSMNLNVYIDKFYKFFSDRKRRIISFTGIFLLSTFVLYKTMKYISKRRELNCKRRVIELIKLEISEKSDKFMDFEIKKKNVDDEIDIAVKILKNYNYKISDNVIKQFKDVSKNREVNNHNDSIRDFREFSFLENTSINYASVLDLNINMTNLSKSQIEFYYYLFMKISNTVNKDILDEFQEKRLKLFTSYIKEPNQELLNKYIDYCLKMKNTLRDKENDLHSDIMEALIEINYCNKINETSSKKTNANKALNDINLDKIKKFYYNDSNEELPLSLDFQKTYEILIFLFEKSKQNIEKVKKIIKNEDEIHYIAEQLALDETCGKYNINENIVKKAFVVHNISFEIVEEILMEKEDLLTNQVNN